MTFEDEVGCEALWFMNSWVAIRRPSSGAPDGVSIMEHHLPFGDSPPLHVHHQEDEIFHLLEGEMRFEIGGVERLARAGDTLVAPKGVSHTFKIMSEDGVRVLVIAPGGDFEGLVRAVSRPASAYALPTPVAPSPQQIIDLSRLAARNNIEILGPPLA
jgi:quercetin dioxygenase-like cupin family protein